MSWASPSSCAVERRQSNAGDQRAAPPRTGLPAYLRLSVFWFLTGPHESPPRGGGGVVGETSGDWRETHSGDRPDQTGALAAHVGGSNSKTSVTALPACISGRREWGRVKGTDGRAGEWAGTGGWRLYSTGTLFSVLGVCILLPVDFNG